jgi:hypothetical protein
MITNSTKYKLKYKNLACDPFSNTNSNAKNVLRVMSPRIERPLEVGVTKIRTT